MKKLALFLSLSALGLFAQAQSSQADIKYSITYSGDNVEQFKAMMPSAYRIMFKGNNSKLITEGGMQAMMLGDILVKGDEGYTYFVNHTSKTANKYKPEDKDEKDATPPTVTKEKGTATILGYTCNKYKIVTKGKQGDVVNYIWATKDIKFERPKTSSKFGTGQFMYEGIEGFPLKMEMNISQPGMTFQMVMTAVNVKLDGLDDKEFEIPAGYKVEEGLPGLLKMQMEQKSKE